MSTTIKKKKEVEVIYFEDPAKRNKNKSVKNSMLSIMTNSEKGVMKRPEFNQNKAKFDIRKLAMQGMDKSEKEVAMADLLVELGAKKPRNKHVPIKEYLKDAKKRKLEGDDKTVDNNSEEGKEGKSDEKKPKYRRKRDKDDVLGFVDGQIGTYRKGVQFIKAGKSKR